MIRSQRHLNFALKAIHNSPKGRDYFLGACLTKGSRVLSKAENSTKSSKKKEIVPLYYRSSHAEQLVIKKALGKIRKGALRGTTLTIVRKTARGLSMAKPCPNCMKLIEFVGITDIRYTDWNGNLTKLQEEIPEEPN